ncbi:MAG: prepilin-type N-terminal cleavage/methylation domain-containing protein [Candidatus Omnitrophica bacterium]|nr:prepilin-type N-terminal cleavage/methylation domain-containing protein [Candidatus Omnitrophota bacterium]
MGQQRGFTLIELLMVVVIVGVVATFALPNYWNARLRAHDREARGALLLLQTAEESEELRTNSYAACADTAACNNALNLTLATNGFWTYRVTAGGGGFCAEAASASHGAWHIGPGDPNILAGDCTGGNDPNRPVPQ